MLICDGTECSDGVVVMGVGGGGRGTGDDERCMPLMANAGGLVLRLLLAGGSCSDMFKEPEVVVSLNPRKR